MAEQKNIGTTYKNFPVPNTLLAEIESHIIQERPGKKSLFYAQCLEVGFRAIKAKSYANKTSSNS